MKKFLIFGLVLLLAFSVVGCSSDQPTGGNDANEQPSNNEASDELKDGTYLVKKEVSSHGNFPLAIMEVKDGEIVSFEYNEYLAESGEPKNLDNYKYEPTIKVIEDLNKQFMEKKDPEALDYDAVSGASHTKESFKEVAKELLAKAKKGETYAPKYKDGVYEAKADKASHGWLAQIKLVVKHGTIVGADYDEVAVEDDEGAKVVFNEDGEPVKGEDGKYKTEPVQIKKGDEKSLENYKYIESPQAMVAFEKQIIDNDGVDNMNYDVVSGATHTKDNIVNLAKKALENAKK
ncbi:hypothetical protein [Thermohalobacter berrensis]|uniref:FMN-binding protein n=1 Tax=Thermohalobacter berrensis TaxID=99594 RepID=A0A419T6H7_9FIRM|nr:hypothetical protein [Thermohalobacter berrensis]RKD33207.1 hypothetical protein BET03_09860 [Thermohalobacter berrensis]